MTSSWSPPLLSSSRRSTKAKAAAAAGPLGGDEEAAASSASAASLSLWSFSRLLSLFFPALPYRRKLTAAGMREAS